MNSLAKHRIEHAQFRVDQDVVEGAILAACCPPDAVERIESLLIEQDTRDDVEPLVAGRAGDAGEARQALALGENFFDHEDKSPWPSTGCRVWIRRASRRQY